MVCGEVSAAFPPYQRNTFTTNPAVGFDITGDVLSIPGNGSSGALDLMDNDGSHLVRSKTTPTLSVNVTNIVGLVERSSATLMEFDYNTAQDFSVTNPITAATTCILTNGAAGQEMEGLIQGEAAGGTSRVVTFIPQLGGLICSFNDFGTAVAVSYSETLTNGNLMEWNSKVRRVNGTNYYFFISRQGKR